jgi:hypothetical protein
MDDEYAGAPGVIELSLQFLFQSLDNVQVGSNPRVGVNVALEIGGKYRSS